MSDERRKTAWIWIAHLCALGLAAAFLYAAYHKIRQPNQFVIDINSFEILPRPYTNLVAILLPWWEVGAAFALIIEPVPGRFRRAGAILIGGMLVMFIVVIGIAMAEGRDISCGCFGEGSGKVGWSKIGQNVLLLIATGIAYAVRMRVPGQSHPVAGDTGPTAPASA